MSPKEGIYSIWMFKEVMSRQRQTYDNSPMKDCCGKSKNLRDNKLCQRSYENSNDLLSSVVTFNTFFLVV